MHHFEGLSYWKGGDYAENIIDLFSYCYDFYKISSKIFLSYKKMYL